MLVLENRVEKQEKQKQFLDLLAKVCPPHSFITWIYIVMTIYSVLSPFMFGRLSWLDEAVVLCLILYGFFNYQKLRKKEIACTFGVMLFFLVYSLYRKVNISQAAFFDFFVFLKPFVAFYVPFYLGTRIQKTYRDIVKYVYLLLGAYCWVLLPYMNIYFTNLSRFYPICILTAISYLYFSNQEKKDYYIALIILIPGLFTQKSKFLVEFLAFIMIMLYVKERIKVSFKMLFLFSAFIIISIYITWTKFRHYFVDTEDEAARTLFYIYAIKNYIDFFPFGSGYGTYATEAAARFYSPLYYKYGFAYVRGLSPESYRTDHNYLNDTFYPILSQFGIVGTLLYIWFWIRRWYDSKRLILRKYKQCIFMFSIMAIQCIAVNSFTGSIGVPYMMMIGMLLSTTRNQKRII